MSMCCNLHAVTPQELEALLAEPWRVQELGARSLEHLQSMAAMLNDPEAAARLFADPEQGQQFFGPSTPDGSRLDLDKNWHILHFLLTGSANEVHEPLGFLLAGGTAVGDVDCGYGPARAYRPSEVKALAHELASLPAETLRQRCTSGAMSDANLYGGPPPGEADGGDEGLLEGGLYYFNELHTFMDRTSRAGNGLVVILS